MFLDLQHITRSFGAHTALRDVTCQLESTRVGLLGPNGAGKSTLLKILLGLLPPTSGTGRIQDRELADGIGLRRLIGYMPEADALVPGLVGVEYVTLAGELCGMQKKQALRRAHEVLTNLGLEEARYRRLEEYSTGMKQRLKLAQALVHDPPVLLLDEPTSGLDPAGRDAMLGLLVSLGRDFGKAILLSTHLLGDVERVCEAVVILHEGRVLCSGPVQELCRRRHDRYRLTLQGTLESYLEELGVEGVSVLANNGRGEVRVAVPRGFVNRAFFVLAEHHGVVVRGLQADDEDLEELFHRVIEQQAPG